MMSVTKVINIPCKCIAKNLAYILSNAFTELN